MERREFLRFAFGVAAGAGAIAAAASAATAAPMLAPQNDLTPRKEPDIAAKPAVADQDDLARATPENVHWRRRHYRRRRYWHRRRHHRW
ncbi:twin-arginine translocation (Tat) [Bradyrhizobium sp. G127]|jgi:hypothetical protein|uniref:twin-arginine translocation (Tat) n=1 Tax=Bradyrhizobium sp. G127 TaxID=2904800 RepID=UPI001F3579AA|nr:twin-arginine translocation (Tat) [Bradyrhizobium sp. G127]MCF2524070.1 twin-arginine translocation (Tat) [Bradyrhizobium sp. G127]